MTDRELDDILYAALVVLDTPEYLELPDEPFPTSPEFEAKMGKMVADPNGYVKKHRRAARPLWRKVLTTAAAVLLVLSVSLAGVMAVSPTARAWVERIVVEWLEEYVGVRFSGDAIRVNDIWRPTYLPPGFQEVDSLDDVKAGLGYVLYENEAGYALSFDYVRLTDENQFNIDREHSNYREITLNEQPAHMFSTNMEGWPSYLIWTDENEGMAFMLVGEYEEGTMIQIAESVMSEK